MNNHPEISIIVPVYNDELYLDKCLNSIIHQSFSDFEVILVDDGSTDKSSQICDKYCKEDSRFSVIHQTNSGVAQARNNGIAHSKGKYIMFVDSDDTVERDFCRVPYEIAVTYHVDIVAFCYNHFSENKHCICGPQTKDFGIKTNEEALYLLDDIGIFMWNKLYSRQLFSNIRFIPGYICEEHAVLPKLIYSASSIYFCDSVLYNYNIRNDSISAHNSTNIIFANAHFHMVQIKANDLLSWGFEDLSNMYTIKEAFNYLYWFGLKEKYSSDAIQYLMNNHFQPFFSWRQNLMLSILHFNRHCFYAICIIIKYLRKI